MVFNLVFFTFALHLTFFVQTVFPLEYEKRTQISDIPSDEGMETSTEFDRIKFVEKSNVYFSIASTKTKSVTVVVKNYDPNAICPGGKECGFQMYDDITREPNNPFIKYCTCAEGFQCVQDGENMMQRFFYYRCKKQLELKDSYLPDSCPTEEKTPSDTRSFEDLSDSVSKQPSSEGDHPSGKQPSSEGDHPSGKQPSSEGDHPSGKQPSSTTTAEPLVDSKTFYEWIDMVRTTPPDEWKRYIFRTKQPSCKCDHPSEKQPSSEGDHPSEKQPSSEGDHPSEKQPSSEGDHPSEKQPSSPTTAEPLVNSKTFYEWIEMVSTTPPDEWKRYIFRPKQPSCKCDRPSEKQPSSEGDHPSEKQPSSPTTAEPLVDSKTFYEWIEMVSTTPPDKWERYILRQKLPSRVVDDRYEETPPDTRPHDWIDVSKQPNGESGYPSVKQASSENVYFTSENTKSKDEL